MTPYYQDDHVQLYHGDMRELVSQFDADAVVTDPPYGETSLAWDRWPEGWPSSIPASIRAMWCFGSMRMFLDRRDEFRPDWRLSQDIVWEKPQGTGLAVDRFRRVHEHVTHWYRGAWSDAHHDTPRTRRTGPDNGSRSKGASKGAHLSAAGNRAYVDDGMRLVRSVIHAKSIRRGLHQTEKPSAILELLIRYAVPAGGVVLDPFAGSCSTLLTARQLGRCAVGIEADEAMCEKAAKRLSVLDLFTSDAS